MEHDFDKLIELESEIQSDWIKKDAYIPSDDVRTQEIEPMEMFTWDSDNENSNPTANSLFDLPSNSKTTLLDTLTSKRVLDDIEQPRKKSKNGPLNIQIEQKRNFRDLPDSNHFLIAKSSNGVNLYFPKKQPFVAVNSKSGNLLSAPIHKLMSVAEDRIATEDREKNTPKYSPPDSDQKLSKVLWIDKYRPKHYHELLGDERMFRDVLTWLKNWDFCVFHKPVKRQFLSWQQLKMKSNQGTIQEKRDRYQRPEKRIMLLHGSPGAGKTTLAHVIANHCGYNVIEINASDDRTSETFKTKFNGALDSKAVFGDRKPNILVIDEIDGASQSGGGESFINWLIRLVNPKPSKKKKAKELMRPIICICNDLYAPALRELRPYCQIFNVKPPSNQVLAQKLQEICSWEGVSSDLRGLLALCDSTGGDLRSALNTLQFISKETLKISHSQILNLNSSKDMTKSYMQVSYSLFHVPIGKDNNKYVERLSNLVQGNSMYERMIQTCFENYLNSKVFDISGKKTKEESRFVQQGNFNFFYDLLMTNIGKFQQFQLYSYLPYPIIQYHRLFARAKNLELVYPKTDFQTRQQLLSCNNIAKAFKTSMSTENKRAYKNNAEIILDLIPNLLIILNPDINPINIHALKSEETSVLERLVLLLKCFGFSIIQESDKNGTLTLVLDPPINKLALNENNTINRYSLGIKQMIIAKMTTIQTKKPSTKMITTDKVKKPKNFLVSKDVFGIEQNNSTKGKQIPVLYKFKEGFTNAVRKPISMSYFTSNKA